MKLLSNIPKVTKLPRLDFRLKLKGEKIYIEVRCSCGSRKSNSPESTVDGKAQALSVAITRLPMSVHSVATPNCHYVVMTGSVCETQTAASQIQLGPRQSVYDACEITGSLTTFVDNPIATSVTEIFRPWIFHLQATPHGKLIKHRHPVLTWNY